MTSDLYDILGVPKTATAEQIRAAHRMQSRRHHPDTAEDGCGNPKLFARVQEAYEVLSSPDSRRRYDNKEAAEGDQITGVSPRLLPKKPCAICQKEVYTSQLTLYLGRRMCKSCLYRKQQRAANRPRLSGMREVFWQIKCLGVWLQAHWAVVLLILIACGAASLRLVKLASHSRRPERPPTRNVVSDPTDVALTRKAVSSPQSQAPTDASASVDMHPVLDGKR